MASGVPAAAFADRLPVNGPAGDGLVDLAAAAHLRVVPVRARLAHRPDVGAGQGPGEHAASGAGRGSQGGGAAGDQLGHQPTDDRWRPHRQGVRVSVQRGGQAPQPGEMICDCIDSGGDLFDRQRPVHLRHRRHHPLPVAGPVARHGVSVTIRARSGRGGGCGDRPDDGPSAGPSAGPLTGRLSGWTVIDVLAFVPR